MFHAVSWETRDGQQQLKETMDLCGDTANKGSCYHPYRQQRDREIHGRLKWGGGEANKGGKISNVIRRDKSRVTVSHAWGNIRKITRPGFEFCLNDESSTRKGTRAGRRFAGLREIAGLLPTYYYSPTQRGRGPLCLCLTARRPPVGRR